MTLASAVPDQGRLTELGSADSEAADAFGIEQIVRRAHQIHREHGGFFGYDLEDWVQAWRDLPQTERGREMRQAKYSNESLLESGCNTWTLA